MGSLIERVNLEASLDHLPNFTSNAGLDSACLDFLFLLGQKLAICNSCLQRLHQIREFTLRLGHLVIVAISFTGFNTSRRSGRGVSIVIHDSTEFLDLEFDSDKSIGDFWSHIGDSCTVLSHLSSDTLNQVVKIRVVVAPIAFSISESGCVSSSQTGLSCTLVERKVLGVLTHSSRRNVT